MKRQPNAESVLRTSTAFDLPRVSRPPIRTWTWAADRRSDSALPLHLGVSAPLRFIPNPPLRFLPNRCNEVKRPPSKWATETPTPLWVRHSGLRASSVIGSLVIRHSLPPLRLRACLCGSARRQASASAVRRIAFPLPSFPPGASRNPNRNLCRAPRGSDEDDD